MSESTELKVKSFRISDETAEKIKNISYEIGGNQQQAISKLIEAYEFQKGKAVLTDKKADIEEFENYVSILTKKYMNVLEDNQNIKALVRTEFESELKSKNETIIDLQSQLKKSKEVKEVAVKKANDLEKENVGLNSQIEAMIETHTEEVTNLKAIIKEKDDNNTMLKMSNDIISKQVEQMKAEIEKAKEQQEKLENLQKKYDKLQSDFNALEANLSHVKSEHEEIIKQMKKHENEAIEQAKKECKFDQDKALLELEKVHQKEIRELQNEYMQKMKEYFNSNHSEKKSKSKTQNNTNPLFDDFLKNGITNKDAD